MLSACETTPPPVRTETVEVKVPVKVSVDPRLLESCMPDYAYPQSGKVTMGEALERLHSAETALNLCNNQIKLIREAQK